jgi:uncharacterized protein
VFRKLTVVLALPARAQGAADSVRSFNDPDGLVTDDFARLLEGLLRSVDSETRGRFVVVIFQKAPPEGIEAFVRERMQQWTNLDPRLERGLVLFYFHEPGRAHTESGPELARVLPDAEIQKILGWSMGSPGAGVTYPQSLQKAITAISFAARGALERPRPEAGLFARLRFAPRQLYFRLRAGKYGSGSDWYLIPLFGLILLGIAVGVVIGQIRMIGQTISSGKRRHESGGKIAADMAEKLAVEGLKAAASVAVSAVGSSSSGGSGFSGGGGSFGGGGASGDW